MKIIQFWKVLTCFGKKFISFIRLMEKWMLTVSYFIYFFLFNSSVLEGDLGVVLADYHLVANTGLCFSLHCRSCSDHVYHISSKIKISLNFHLSCFVSFFFNLFFIPDSISIIYFPWCASFFPSWHNGYGKNDKLN